MANTSFSSGFGTGYSITSQWKANKEKKDAIKKQEEQAKAFALDLGARYDRDYKSGTGIDQEEYTNGYLWAMAAGEEQLNTYKDLYKTSMDMTNEELKNNLADVKDMETMYADVDLKDYTAMEEIIRTWKSPRAIAKGQALIKKWKAREAKPEVEKYSTLEEFQAKFGESHPYEYDKEGYLRPKYIAPKTPAALSDYEKKRKNIKENMALSDEEKRVGIYKLDTGIDITKNDDTDGDFTSAEGKRTADFAFTQMFGYTTPDGIKIAGIVPANLARVLSLGRKATDAEKEAVMFDWKSRKGVVRKMGGLMAVEAVETILDQLFRETRPEDIVENTLLSGAIKYVEEQFGGTKSPQGVETQTPEVSLPSVGQGGKSAMVPLMSKVEVKKALESTDQSDPLYKELYDRAVQEGWISK